MRVVIGLLLIAMVAVGCDNKTNEGGILREFETGKALSLNPGEPNTPFQINDGNDIVFRYSFNHPEEEQIADDELTEAFLFSVPETESSFNITTADLTNALPIQMSYYRICFCYFESGFQIESVNIVGTRRNSSEWRITFEMTATDGDHTYTLSDEGTYKATTL